jgi:hypothetical protein
MLALLLATALAAGAPADLLPPEARAHHDRAMVLHDAGDRDGALLELEAAYAAMPDPHAHRAGRDLVLGSLRGLLLDLHDATGAPEPLCRLQTRLELHLTELPPDAATDRAGTRARLDEVAAQLAAHGPAPCDPDTAPREGLAVSPGARPAPREGLAPPREARPAASSGATAAASTPDIPPAQLRAAGGATLGLGVALFGATVYGIVEEARQRGRADAVADAAAGRPLTPGEHAELLDARANARLGRGVAIGSGVASAALIGLGAALLGLAGRADAPRASAAVWATPTAGGLTVRLRFAGPRRPR